MAGRVAGRVSARARAVRGMRGEVVVPLPGVPLPGVPLSSVRSVVALSVLLPHRAVAAAVSLWACLLRR
ncbi:hypothetical protein SCA03_66910 [Streptomyces cacaoi]|uniref:Uncharacterized protein n=1 Tax=Streptomyces cacaoi TaxID=1898 RepID=A0A4Y3REE5_STRCI|nr:hypothetical protein SCA03_66910 [Streptomyces cacaoi]